jgi:hypothetical protein
MGNTSPFPRSPEKNNDIRKSDQNHFESEVFNKQEISLLNNVYKKISTTIASGEISTSLPSKTLFDAMTEANVFEDFYQFQLFIEKCTRSNMTTIIRCIWNLIQDKCNYDDPQGTSTSTGINTYRYSYRLLTFFTIILELLGYEENIRVNHAKRLATTVSTFQVLASAYCSGVDINELRTNQSSSSSSSHPTNSSTDFARLQQWIQKYAPCIPSIFETFFNCFCFGHSNNISPIGYFYSPHLLSESSIISHDAEILPLSFYNIKLQGSWRRLYTSESDGLSFNRVAHHILGYSLLIIINIITIIIITIIITIRNNSKSRHLVVWLCM